MNNNAKDRLIFALDVDDIDQARQWVATLKKHVGVFKIGKQLFTRYGPDVVKMVIDQGGDVFLDLKYHDIPNTVAKAAVEATRLGVKIFNVHALGGAQMMRSAVAEVEDYCRQVGCPRPQMLAVTILTSSDQATLTEIGIDRPVADMVVRLARLTQAAGFDGVVASPHEAAMIHAACGKGFAIVTPGVRPALSAQDDQKRIMTPAAAIAAGATALVIGRPISAADDPPTAAAKILEEMGSALEG